MGAPVPERARPGDAVDAIDTPALVVDLEALERNIAAMARWAAGHGVRLRPHAKTHKCAEIAHRQVAAGAVGVCVQKLGEAEALAEAGIADLYISNEIVDERKLARVAALARRVKLAIAVDSVLGVDRLAQALRAAASQDNAAGAATVAPMDVFVEVDVGHGRCGVAPAAAGPLARRVVSHGDVLRFAGLQAYHGRAQHVRGADEREATIRQATAAARAAQVAVTSAGIACPLVTGAGTGSFPFEAGSRLWGELQAGSYVFLDRDYADNERAPGSPVFEHALFVKSQVMSRGAAHAVVDAGHKSHAVDSGLPRVWGREGLVFVNGGDEHGILRAAPGADPSAVLPALGEMVWLVPGHCDPTVNLHEALVAVRGGLEAGRVEACWAVEARGRAD